MVNRKQDTNWLTNSLNDQAEKLLRADAKARGIDLRDMGILSKRRMYTVHNKEYSKEYLQSLMSHGDDG